jgi:hypothetical protein
MDNDDIPHHVLYVELSNACINFNNLYDELISSTAAHITTEIKNKYKAVKNAYNGGDIFKIYSVDAEYNLAHMKTLVYTLTRANKYLYKMLHENT